MEEANGRLEKDLKNFSSAEGPLGRQPRSESSGEPRLDLFASELEVQTGESSEEGEEEGSRAECCEGCLKTFGLSLVYCNESLERILHLEILEFEQQVSAIHEGRADMFARLFARIRTIIGESLRLPFELYTYGSFASGLNLPWSDVDLLLDIYSDNDISSLEKLEAAFAADTGGFAEARFIRGASIPVLKLTAAAEFEGCKLDITLKDDRHSGLSCVALVRQYVAMYPPLRPLALVLKQLLHISHLNDPYQQGLSSYGLVLMIVAFLQWLAMNGCLEDASSNFGKLLLEFLKHYGSYFDYLNWKVAPSLPQDPLINPYPQVTSSEPPKLLQLLRLQCLALRHHRPTELQQQRCQEHPEVLCTRGKLTRSSLQAHTHHSPKFATASFSG